jgi:hypothetical protein
MALATLNGLGIIQGRIGLPRIGAWTADLVVDAEDVSQVQDPLLLQLGDSEADASLSLKGVSVRKGAETNAVTVKMVGGAGGLATQLPPKYYQGVQLQLPLADALGAGGETLSGTSSQAILSQPLSFWTRGAGPVSDLLTSLLAGAPAGTSWRILPDGTLWVGAETWPAAVISAELLVDAEYLARQDLGVEVPNLLPGTTFSGRNVSFVEHLIENRRVRTIVYYEVGQPLSDRAKNGLEQFVLSLFQRNLYLTSPVGTVVQQRGDDSLDVQLDDPRFPGMTSVPLRTGFPGLQVKVAPKSRVRVFWDNGDPSKPSASLFDAAAGSSLEVDLVATLVALGSQSAADFLVKGTTYLNAEAQTMQSVGNTFAALAPVVQALTSLMETMSGLSAVVPAITPVLTSVSDALQTLSSSLQQSTPSLEAFSGSQQASFISTQVKTA